MSRINLYFYIIILLSFYAIQVLSNPITERPTPTLQKRQTVFITTTSYSTTTNINPFTPAVAAPSRETFSPSKLKNCIGPVKFSKVNFIVITKAAVKTVNFIAEGKTSELIDTAIGNLYNFLTFYL